MAVTGTALTPGGTSAWTMESWDKVFEFATYQKLQLVAVVDEGTRPYNLGHHRRAQRVTGATLGQSDDGTNLTYVSPVGTTITVTPVGSTVPIAWSDNMEAQSDAPLDRNATNAIEGALAELTEKNVAANIQSGTQIMSTGSIDAGILRQAVARLETNTNGNFAPGEDATIYGFFSTTQKPSMMAIPEINSAEMRGDNENPYVRGTISKGYGLVLLWTTVAALDANGYHNAVMAPSAITIDWNTRSRIKNSEVELQTRKIGFNNVGSALKNDLRLIPIRSTASGL